MRTNTVRPWLYFLAALVGVFALSFVVEGMGSYDERIIVNIGINMILATSLNLINGFTGQFSLGHAGFMSVGAYTTAAFVTIWAPDLFGEFDGTAMQGVVLLIGILLGGVTAALAGLLVGIPSLRLKGDYLAIVTLGFGEIIRVVLNNVPQLGGSLGMGNLPRYTTFLWVFITVVILVFIVKRLIGSTYGKGFLAVRDDEVAAEAMGVDTTRYKVTAFVIGAFFAGVAGGLYAHYNQLIRPEDFGFIKSVEIVVMVILGGMGSTYGVLFAAAILTFLPEWMRDVEFIGIKFRDFRMSIYALILIVLMLTRPQGLFGDGSGTTPAFPEGKSVTVTYLLGILLGQLGAHWFYLGQVKRGIARLIPTLACTFVAVNGDVSGATLRTLSILLFLWNMYDAFILYKMTRVRKPQVLATVA